MSRSMREAYVEALYKRIQGVVIEEVPEGMGRVASLWEALVPLDRDAYRKSQQYLEGKLTKDELDAAAVKYLHAFREQVKLFREGKVA